MVHRLLLNKIFERESTNTCKSVVQTFSRNTCRTELMLKNGCSTCPFQVYKQSILISYEEQLTGFTTPSLIVTSEIPNPTIFIGVKWKSQWV